MLRPALIRGLWNSWVALWVAVAFVVFVSVAGMVAVIAMLTERRALPEGN